MADLGHFAPPSGQPLQRRLNADQGKSVGDLNPDRGVIARLLPAANLAIDANADEPRRKRGTEQQMIDAQPTIAPEVISKVIPEGVDALLGMHPAQRVGPAARE